MFYAQSTARVVKNIREKISALIPQVQFWFRVYETITVFMIREVWEKNEVEWIGGGRNDFGKSPDSWRNLQSHFLTYSGLWKREPLIALGSHLLGDNLISAFAVPRISETGSQISSPIASIWTDVTTVCVTVSVNCLVLILKAVAVWGKICLIRAEGLGKQKVGAY